MLPLTACCLSQQPGFESGSKHMRKLPMPWVRAVVFTARVKLEGLNHRTHHKSTPAYKHFTRVPSHHEYSLCEHQQCHWCVIFTCEIAHFPLHIQSLVSGNVLMIRYQAIMLTHVTFISNLRPAHLPTAVCMEA